MTGDTILLVDDDAELRRLVGDYLRENGFAVREAADVPSMRAALAKEKPDLLVLDLMMPEEDGLAALRTMPHEVRVPTIMLSAMAGDADRIVGLEMGADDYVAKPCNPRELLARIRAVLRRARDGDTEQAALAFAGWTLDPARFELRDPAGEPVALTTGEFRLLHALAAADRAVLSRETLAARLGGPDYEAFDRAIDLAVSRLRNKLAAAGGDGLIRTVRGEGYAFAVPVKRG